MKRDAAAAAPAIDHRRATAQRNRQAILNALERILAEHRNLTMAALAAEAGVSRPTLYAHFGTLADAVEAAVERSVAASVAALEKARPDDGPADAAIGRMIEASWEILGSLEALARGAAEHLSAEQGHRSHHPLMALMAKVVERGQREGVFRTDMPSSWLVTSYYALVHNADGYARSPDVGRRDVLALLKTTTLDLLRVRAPA